MTLTVTGEPSFLALTITPSIGPSSVEATWPASAAAPWAAAGGLELERTRVNANAAPTTKAMRDTKAKPGNCIAASLDSTCAIGSRGRSRGPARIGVSLEPHRLGSKRLPAVWAPQRLYVTCFRRARGRAVPPV